MDNVTIDQYNQLKTALTEEKTQSVNALKNHYKDCIGHELSKLNRALQRPLSERHDLDEVQLIIQRSLAKIERYINQ